MFSCYWLIVNFLSGPLSFSLKLCTFIHNQNRLNMILHFIITALVIYGVKASTDPGMLLGWVRIKFIVLMDRIFTKAMTYTQTNVYYSLITKPLFDCTPCMASVYGTISYWVYYPDPTISGWVIWVFALAGFNYIVNKLINR